MSDQLYHAVGWVLTYLVHSTVLIGGVWLLLRVAPFRSNAVREVLWTLALFGGLVTATAQTINGVKPLGGTYLLPAPTPSVDESPLVAGSSAQSRPHQAPAASVLFFLEDQAFGAVPPVDGPAGPESSVPAQLTSNLAANAWKVSIGLVLALILFYFWLMTRGLGDRRPLVDGPLPGMLDRLRSRAGVTRRVALTVSRELSSPVALGLVRPEICLPERALRDLSPAQQEGMLGHELAHIVRGDPLRLLCCRLIELLFFFQPLNRLARRRLFETVECRCDAWAIEQNGRGLALAECLAEVATWIAEKPRPVAAVAMARGGSPLGRRIRRLLEEDEALARDRRQRRWAPFLSLLLPILVLVAPVVSIAASAPTEAAAEPENEFIAEDGRFGPEPTETDRLHRSEEPDRADLIMEAARLLSEEIDLLGAELSNLRAALPKSSRFAEFNETLSRLTRRIEQLKHRRDLLMAWREKMLGEHGLDLPERSRANTTASPWSNQR